MNFKIKLCIAAFALVLTSGCATSVPRALNDIRKGMDKDQVLNTAGNPKRTYRENSEDHWQYEYFEQDKLWRREVVFSEGKVLKITRPVSKEEWVKELEKADSMEEFEAKAREHQKESKSGDFKSIDGEPDDEDPTGK